MDKTYVFNDIDEQKLKERSVFISYGHDEFLPYARKLAKDLSEIVGKVWFDEKQIRSAHKWDEEIENGISNSSMIIALMTPHAYRRPGGVCMNEVVYAAYANKEIIPVLVDDVSVPLLLCRIQYVDVREIYNVETGEFDEAKYDETFRRLLICLEEPGNYDANYSTMFKKTLKPIDNTLELAYKTKNFVGRKWLLDEVEKWAREDEESSVFMLLGGPGTGKSSFIAKLANTMSEVKGVHFCNFQNDSSLKVKTMIRTLAYYLSVSIHEYDEIVEFDMLDLEKASDYECFYKLVLDPIHKIKDVKEKIILAIDGIDEMGDDVGEFLSILTEAHERFPKWLKLVVTSRDNKQIVSGLGNLKPYILRTAQKENIEDIREYIRKECKNLNLSIEDENAIIEHSEGCFQYVVHMIPEIIERGELVEAELPNGIVQAYNRRFDRLFKSKGIDEVRPLLGLLCAQKEPLSLHTINQIIPNDKVRLDDISFLSDYIRAEKKNESEVEKNTGDKGIHLVFFHKSIADWLLDADSKYYIELLEANKMLADWIVKNAEDWDYIEYISKYGFGHLAEAEFYDDICDILDNNENECKASFVEFMYGIKTKLSKYKRLFRKICKSVDSVERYIIYIMHDSYEKRGYTEYISDIADSFNEAISWADEYAEMLKLIGNGKLEEAKAKGEEVMEAIEMEGCSDDAKALVINDYGECYRITGDFDEAMEIYKSAFELYKPREYASKCFWSWYNYHDLMAVKGDLDEAKKQMEWMMKKVPEISVESFKIWRILGNINLYLEKRMESCECYEMCEKIAKKLYSKRLMGEANYVIAEALAGVDNEKAWRHLDEAIDYENQLKYKPGMARTYMARTELLVAEEKWNEAIEVGIRGIEMLDSVNYYYGSARVGRSVAKAYEQLGDLKKAHEYIKKSYDFLESKKAYPIEKEQVKEELARISDKLDKV
ncbi:MAG: TIR domain-containing protein [Lachnospiraceae bacterium]|nr:TIR domain-containing protein [Lachnospiraceae bacterium]